LSMLLEALERDPAASAIYLGRPEATITSDPSEPPRRQVLPMAVRVQPASRAAREAVEAGRRSLQALLEAMAAIELPSSAWLRLDPDGSTLTDVDTPADLDRVSRR
jgi:hypothetical protein